MKPSHASLTKHPSKAKKVLELFAGSRSVSKAAEKLGMAVFSSDVEPFEQIDYAVDINKFDIATLPFKPDIIWASPPCQAFSIMSFRYHWTGGKNAYVPKSTRAHEGIKMVKKTLQIIKQLNPQFYFIENPRGMLRKMKFMEGMKRHTVSYCQYGDTRMKPTDIWTNSERWVPKPICKNGAPCHEAAPRGSHTGTVGLKNAFERSKIPEQLCLEVLQSCNVDSNNEECCISL